MMERQMENDRVSECTYACERGCEKRRNQTAIYVLIFFPSSDMSCLAPLSTRTSRNNLRHRSLREPPFSLDGSEESLFLSGVDSKRVKNNFPKENLIGRLRVPSDEQGWERGENCSLRIALLDVYPAISETFLIASRVTLARDHRTLETTGRAGDEV